MTIEQVADEEVATINEPQVNEEPVDTQVNEQSQPTAQQILDWTKDEKFEKVWKKDPNQLYKSYQESQKQWKEHYTPISQVLKEHKFKTADDLKGYIESRKDYDVLKTNEENFMNLWNHPTFGPKVQQIFKDIELENQKLQQDPVYQKETRLQQLEQKLSQYEQKEYQRENQIKLDSNLDEANKLAKKYGIKNFNENEFITELMSAGPNGTAVPFEGIKSYFIEKFLPEIIKSEKARAESGVVNNLKNNAKGSILADTKSANKKTDLTWDQAISGVLGN